MLLLHRQWSIAIFIAVWLTALGIPSSANDSKIHVQAKGLAHYIMAVMDDLNGDNQHAISEYQKSIKFDHKQPLSHLRLGAYYARYGRLAQAVVHLKEVVRLQPNSSQAHYLLALIYSSQKKYGLAADEYELILKTASKNNPDNTEIYSYLAQLYYSLHKYSQAIEQLNQILQAQPKNVSAKFLLGVICLDLDDRHKAREEFQQVLALEPQHDGALNSLAYLYAEEGVHLDEAFKMIHKAIDLDPSNGAYYDTLGWVLFKKGFNAESLMTLEKAQNYITDPIIFEHMADVYMAEQEPALARKFWLKSLALDSKQPKVLQKIEQLNRTSARTQERNSILTK